MCVCVCVCARVCCIQCAVVRKTTYTSQLKKMKDTSNTAIRNSIQSERLGSTMLLQQLQNKMEAVSEGDIKSLETRLEEAGRSLVKLQTELQEQQRQTVTYRRDCEKAEENKQLAVDRATSDLR